MKLLLKPVLLLMVAALVAGPMVEGANFKGHQDCPCCSNACQGSPKCHNTARACLCSHQLPFQVVLSRNNILPKLIFAGLISDNPDSSYLYLSTKDIFHPPRVC